MKPIDGEAHFLEASRARERLAILDGFVAGRLSRAEVVAWAMQRLDQRHWILESIVNLDEHRDGVPVVSVADVAWYAEELRAGGPRWDERGLVKLPRDAESLSASTGVPVHRSWVAGLGWEQSLRFGSLATGRGFSASILEMRPGGPTATLSTCHGDDPQEAAIDLLETLALRWDEVTWWSPEVDLAKLPVWAVWRQDDNGNELKVTDYPAFSTATAVVEAMAARGHKQTYWTLRER
jgi:hypothetical protein